MNSVKCMSLEQNPALSTVCPGPGINNFDVSLRPILSAIGIADYNLNNFFLYLFFLPKFNIKDYFPFATEISSLPDSNSYFMASSDIKSLFANIA